MNKRVPDANPKLLLRPHFFLSIFSPKFYSTFISDKHSKPWMPQCPVPGSLSHRGLLCCFNPSSQSYTSWLIKFPSDSLSTQVTVSGDLGALSWKGIFPQLRYEAPSLINRFPFFFKSSMLPSPTSASCTLPVGHKGPVPTTQFSHLLPAYSLQVIICVWKTIHS